MSEAGPQRPWYQLSLRSILFLGVPFAAILGWIVALDGPWLDPRRVVTHKVSLVILLANTVFVIWALRVSVRPSQRSQVRSRIGILMLSVWLIVVVYLAAAILRNRAQAIDRETQANPAEARAGS